MDEISNKTLATLLVVAIVISLAGTFFAMRGVSTVTNFVNGPTGAYATSGVAKVNITETVSIILNNPTVDFGDGYRQPSFLDSDLCNLTSSVAKPTACWNATTYAPADFQVENNGNVNVNITINSTTSASYFANCTGSKTVFTTPRYEFAGKNLSGGTRPGCTATTDGLVTANTSFTDLDILLCKNLSSTDTVDQFNISITLGVPKGPTGECGRGVTFTAARNY